MRAVMMRGLGLGAVALVFCAWSAQASVYWEGSTSRGSANFEGVELQPGRFGFVVNDPTGAPGSVFYCETYGGDPNYLTGRERCEMKGSKLPDGSIWRMAENIGHRSVGLRRPPPAQTESQ